MTDDDESYATVLTDNDYTDISHGNKIAYQSRSNCRWQLFRIGPNLGALCGHYRTVLELNLQHTRKSETVVSMENITSSA